MQKFSSPATVELELDNAPESVALVRAALTGFGLVLGFGRELLEDLQMVASEACNNVVLHAYCGARGPLSLRLAATPNGLELTVRDRGEGFEPPGPGDELSGLGVAVIQSLADHSEFTAVPEGGTEVQITFRREISALAEVPAVSEPAASKHSVRLDGDVIATVSPVELLPGVLSRLTRTLAAQARFSVKRFADIQAVVDSLADHAQRCARNGAITVSLGTEIRRVMVGIGPLGSDPCPTPTQSPPLAQLVDELEVHSLNDSKVLHLTLSERGLANVT